MMNAIYSEQDMYSKELIQVMSQAGLIPVEEEVSLEEYLRATNAEVM